MHNMHFGSKVSSSRIGQHKHLHTLATVGQVFACRFGQFSFIDVHTRRRCTHINQKAYVLTEEISIRKLQKKRRRRRRRKKERKRKEKETAKRKLAYEKLCECVSDEYLKKFIAYFHIVTQTFHKVVLLYTSESEEEIE